MDIKDSEDKTGKQRRQPRPYIGITWECCKVYSRIYLNRKGSAYVGWCPRCGKRAQLDLSPTGSKSRFFQVG
ncbi:MAG: hypothetical protein V1794_00595 [Candidatus Glassbacteria bacterium]